MLIVGGLCCFLVLGKFIAARVVANGRIGDGGRIGSGVWTSLLRTRSPLFFVTEGIFNYSNKMSQKEVNVINITFIFIKIILLALITSEHCPCFWSILVIFYSVLQGQCICFLL